MINWLLETLRILFLIVFAGLIFYFTSPKYFFSDNGGIRGNKITGKVELYKTLQGQWVDVMENPSDKINRLEKLIQIEKERLLLSWKSSIEKLPEAEQRNIFETFLFKKYGGNKTNEELNLKAEELAKQRLGIDSSDLEEDSF